MVVAGHAVTMAESLDGVDALDSSWYLLDYQRRADVPSPSGETYRRGRADHGAGSEIRLSLQRRADAARRGPAVGRPELLARRGAF